MASSPALTRAVIYTRISQDRSGEGLGVARQRKDCQALCDRLGYTVVEVVEENDTSASKGKRPRWKYVLGMIERGEVDALVAWHADRLYRRLADLEELVNLVERSNIQIKTVQSGDVDLSTASGRMTARIIGAVARAEVEHMTEKITNKMDELADKGLYSGGARAYGYDQYSVTLVPEEAAVIREVVDRVLAGERLGTLVRELADRGVTGSRGKGLHQTSLTQILVSARIAGLRKHRGEVVGKAAWPAIITEDEHRRLLAILKDPARQHRKGREHALLTGILKCCWCGHGLVTGHSGKLKPGEDWKEKRKYKCNTQKGGCGRLAIDAYAVEDAFVAILLRMADTPDVARYRSASPEPVSVVETLEAQIRALKEMRDAGQIDFAEWQRERAEFQQRLDVARKADQAAVAKVARKAAARAHLDGLTQAKWDSLPSEAQRTIAQGVISSITVGPGLVPGAGKKGRAGVVPPEERLTDWMWTI